VVPVEGGGVIVRVEMAAGRDLTAQARWYLKPYSEWVFLQL